MIGKNSIGKGGAEGAGAMGPLGFLTGLMGMAGYAVARAHADRHKEKTREEYESEIEKWEKQTRMAHTTILDLSFVVAEKCRLLAAAEESARVEKLATDRAEEILTEEVGTLTKEVTRLKVALAGAEAAVVAATAEGAQAGVQAQGSQGLPNPKESGSAP